MAEIKEKFFMKTNPSIPPTVIYQRSCNTARGVSRQRGFWTVSGAYDKVPDWSRNLVERRRWGTTITWQADRCSSQAVQECGSHPHITIATRWALGACVDSTTDSRWLEGEDGIEVVKGDITDGGDTVRRAVDGVEAVIHLASDPPASGGNDRARTTRRGGDEADRPCPRTTGPTGNPGVRLSVRSAPTATTGNHRRWASCYGAIDVYHGE